MSPGKANVSTRKRNPAVEPVRGTEMIHRPRYLPLQIHTSTPPTSARVHELLRDADAAPADALAADALAADALAADALAGDTFGEPIDRADAERTRVANLSVLQVAHEMLARIIQMLR